MSLLSQAEELINNKKTAAELKAEDYYSRAMRIGEVFAVEKEYLGLIPKLGKCEALGIEDNQLRAKYQCVLKQRKEIFKAHSIDEKMFIPQYSCAKCNDTGYEKGKSCICLRQAVNNIITNEYGIDVSKFKRFEDTDMDKNPLLKNYLEDKYDNMIKYCKGFPRTKYKTHIFTGLSGTGKTYLASCVAKKIIDRGYSVIFITAFKMNEIFLKYHLDFRGEGNLYLDNLYTCDFLVLDDLGTENTFKNVTNEYLLSLISERMANERHTLITTNLESEHIRLRYDDRLHSRLLDKQKTYIFNFNGEDLRQIR